MNTRQPIARSNEKRAHILLASPNLLIRPNSMYNHPYFGLDAHKRTCTLAGMDLPGDVVSARTFPTSESLLIHNVSRIHAKTKWLALEESTLSGWIAGILRPHVDRLIVCDPVHNTLISRGGNKDDVIDAVKICRLFRLDELKEVYHPNEGHRVDFKIAVQQYLRICKGLSSLKTQLKAKYNQASLVHVTGTEVFTKKPRVRYLNQLSTPSRRKVFALLYDRLDATDRSLKKGKAVMVELGQRYPEIARFRRVPGIGEVGSHVFSAFIQTPHRFGTKQQLWRYCVPGRRVYNSAIAVELQTTGSFGIWRAEIGELPMLAILTEDQRSERGFAVL